MSHTPTEDLVPEAMNKIDALLNAIRKMVTIKEDSDFSQLKPELKEALILIVESGKSLDSLTEVVSGYLKKGAIFGHKVDQNLLAHHLLNALSPADSISSAVFPVEIATRREALLARVLDGYGVPPGDEIAA